MEARNLGYSTSGFHAQNVIIFYIQDRTPFGDHHTHDTVLLTSPGVAVLHLGECLS